jgi:ATPase family associated with various cellular activities (AAA)/AAA lid domain
VVTFSHSANFERTNPPGTGKTTCAELYGRLLRELGFLSSGDVVSKTASDFVGNVVGESQTKTNQILESARGKVLIVDEAYALDDSLYGKQVLDTIVEKVHGNPNEDIAVLLLGYEEQMLAMLRNQNPGLTRRFPKEHAFYFDDYNDNELLEIMKGNLKANQVKASLEFCEKALAVLRKQRAQSNFGNAGAAELIVKGALLRAADRLSTSCDAMTLEDVDIDDPGTVRSEKDSDPLSLLDGLYRMSKVKDKLEQMQKAWAVSKRDGDEEPNLGHFVFTGSPGKYSCRVATTMSRCAATLTFCLGISVRNRENNCCSCYCRSSL